MTVHAWSALTVTNLFLTFVVFACFATTRFNIRFRAKNTGFGTGLNPVYATLYWWPCDADGRTDGHVTITSLPKFLGLTGYQISLAMVLRWRASTRAPLLKHSLSEKCRKPSTKKMLRDVKVLCRHICSYLLSIVSLNRFRSCRQVKFD